MTRNVLLQLCAVAVTAGVSAEAAPSNTQLPEKEAKILVEAALPREARRLRGMAIEATGRDEAYPRFLAFMVTWTGSPTGGSVVGGYYDVDPMTGEVFAGTGCKRYLSDNISRARSKLKRVYNIQDDRGEIGPYCE